MVKVARAICAGADRKPARPPCGELLERAERRWNVAIEFVGVDDILERPLEPRATDRSCGVCISGDLRGTASKSAQAAPGSAASAAMGLVIGSVPAAFPPARYWRAGARAIGSLSFPATTGASSHRRRARAFRARAVGKPEPWPAVGPSDAAKRGDRRSCSAGPVAKGLRNARAA